MGDRFLRPRSSRARTRARGGSVLQLTPVDGAAMTAQVPIAAAVDGGTPDRVDLWVDDGPVATVSSPPVSGVWHLRVVGCSKETRDG